MVSGGLYSREVGSTAELTCRVLVEGLADSHGEVVEMKVVPEHVLPDELGSRALEHVAQTVASDVKGPLDGRDQVTALDIQGGQANEQVTERHEGRVVVLQSSQFLVAEHDDQKVDVDQNDERRRPQLKKY